MKSMTGFGRSETDVKGGTLTVEARSENHRFFDARVSLPDGADFLERSVRARLGKAVLRGKVKLTVVYEETLASGSHTDIRNARRTLAALRKLKKELGLKGEITVDHILSFDTRSSVRPKLPASQIKRAVASAVRDLDESRTCEGGRLAKDISSRISKCSTLLRRIKRARASYETQMKRKIVRKARDAAKNNGADEARVYQEMTLAAERSDITEEVVRMNSHITRFGEFLSQTGISVGRELDFLTQEMNREAGTILAKSKSTAISRLAVDLRSEIERVREQVQNVE